MVIELKGRLKKIGKSKDISPNLTILDIVLTIDEENNPQDIYDL